MSILQQEQTELSTAAPARLGRHDCRVVLCILAVAFVFYLLLWPQAPLLSLDSSSYMRLARDIRARHLSELSIRTPGFPLLLLIAGSESAPTRALYYVQLLLYFSSAGLLAALLRMLQLDRRCILGFVLLSILPPFVEPCAYADSECLCEFLVVMSVFAAICWVRTRQIIWLAPFSLGAAGAAFVRPTYQFMAIAMGTGLLLGQAAGVVRYKSAMQVMRAVVVPVGLVVAAVFGWSAVNYANFRYFDTSAMTAITLAHKTATFIECLPDRFAGLRSILLKHRDSELLVPYSDHTGQNYVHRALPEIIRLYGNDRTRAFQDLKAADIYLITHKPMSYLIDGMKAEITYWMPEDGELSTSGSGMLRALWAGLQLAMVAVFMMLSVTAAGLSLLFAGTRLRGVPKPAVSPPTADRIAAYGIALVVVCYATVISCFGGMGLPRFRETSDLLILLCCFLGGALFHQGVGHLADHTKQYWKAGSTAGA